jgi:sugar phosphate isomerase/epimerase
VKLGFLTACLPGLSLSEVARVGAELGLDAIEVAAWPAEPLMAHEYSPCHLDVRGLDQAGADRVGELLAGHGLAPSSLAFYANNLHADRAVRAAIHDHLRACIDAAALLGCPLVGTSVGADPSDSLRGSIGQAEEVFPPLVEYAAGRGVRIVIENCAMTSWHPDRTVGNLAYSPELWDWLAGLGLWLNFDPSHLLWQGIDPVAALGPVTGLVLHTQAKDVELLPDRRQRTGWLGSLLKPDAHAARWYRYRMPGLGQVDWRGVVDTLHQAGYQGVVSIEHEDPVWEGSTERVVTGLRIARRALDPLVRP